MNLRVALWCLLTGLAGLAMAAEPAAPTKEASAADGAAATTTEKASDADRETEIAAILPRLTVDDELQWLEANGRKCFAFSRKPHKGKPRGAILIVPAAGEFIDERALIRTLRSLPPGGGFMTLALQAPLSPAAAPVADAAADASTPAPTDLPAVHAEFCPRVAAALASLEADATPLLAIAAAGDSASAVLGCYPDGLPAGVGAFAAIGGWQGSLAKLKVPTIEFVPGRDPMAVAAADRRAAAPLADDAPPRRRVDLDGVDRSFTGADVEVAKRLRGWLERLPPPAAANTATAP